MHPSDIPHMEKALEDRGLTASDLCRKAGIAKTTWWRWKGGEIQPNFRAWDRVVGAFNDLTSEKGAA